MILEIVVTELEMTSEEILYSVESRLNLGGSDVFSGDTSDHIMGSSVTLLKDDKFDVYLRGCASVKCEEKDPELSRCWSMVDITNGLLRSINLKKLL